ncbi:MAG: VWA domain-containing protein [Deltaproteobacteria bacterium]|nr:VWA domain-containing protein [Deltaproteobacteria bacterium]
MTRRALTQVLTLAVGSLAIASCTARPLEIPLPRCESMSALYLPQTLETKVDILFVIDNSGSMEQEQKNLATQFPRLIEALRHEQLGGRIPDVHIGVVTTDLGAGSYGLPSCEVSGGDGGALQHKARIAGCTPPQDPWIAYDFTNDHTNIPGCQGDGVSCVKEAFSCIAQVGTQGCGFESPLEAARRALDPKRNTNPGFLRKDALLAVVFITDEDDCSARNPQLFDPQQQSLSDPLGPLSSFRCFEFGIQCDVNDRNATGERKHCTPAFDWLYKVDDYVSFFRSLKAPGDRVLMAAIAGPTSPVIVGKDGSKPTLAASCQSGSGFAVPALRIAHVVSAFDGTVDPICAPDFGPALRTIGARIRNRLGAQCLTKPVLTDEGKGLCDGRDADGAPCEVNNLQEADCLVEEHAGGLDSLAIPVPRCPTELFDPAVTSCGATCPCWRVVRRPADRCGPKATPPSTAFGVDILHAKEPETGTTVVARCRVTIPACGAVMAL